MTMAMDAGEICRNYAAAKNKNDQVKVLADLNACTTQEILDILTRNDMIQGIPAKPEAKKRSPGRWTPEDERELIKLYEAGNKSAEIAEKLGYDQRQVWDKIYHLKKKGYIFASPKQKQAKPKQKPQADPEPEEKMNGDALLGMLCDSLPPDITVLAVTVQFRDSKGCCWQLRAEGIEI